MLLFCLPQRVRSEAALWIHVIRTITKLNFCQLVIRGFSWLPSVGSILSIGILAEVKSAAVPESERCVFAALTFIV